MPTAAPEPSPAIFHLTPAAYFYEQPVGEPYRPPTLEQEGFIHCTAGRDVLLQVANAFFQELEGELLALEIDERAIRAPVRYEPPAPMADGGQAPLFPPDLLFPHVYGPLNRDAIVDVHRLAREAGGRWQFPPSF